jgi:Ni,Fe-hydrogenase I large subunit
MIISVGYRVKSKIATKFRKWATQTLRDYIVQGYVLNDQRLIEKSKQLENLKNTINLIEESISNKVKNIEEVKQLNYFLNKFSKGFELLNDFDHEILDKEGKIKAVVKIIKIQEFLNIIKIMKKDFDSNIFGLQKDKSLESSVNQIYQSLGSIECYPTIEEKAAIAVFNS